MAIRLFPRGHIGSRPPTGAFTINRDSPQRKGLVAWYPMLASIGINGVLDRGDTGINGTFTGSPTWGGSPDFGWGLTTSNGNYYTAPSTGLNVQQGTVAAWLLPTTQTINTDHLVWSNGTSTTHRVFFECYGARWVVQYSSQSALEAAPGSGGLNQTVHFVMTWDRTAQLILGYFNGKQILSTALTVAAITPSASNYFGAYYTGGFPFLGSLGEFRIYNRALSANEVWQHFAPETRYDLYLPVAPRFWSVPAAAPPAGVAMPIFGNDDQLFGSIFGGAIVR